MALAGCAWPYCASYASYLLSLGLLCLLWILQVELGLLMPVMLLTGCAWAY